MSKAAIVKFADTILQHFPPYRWDDGQEKGWAGTLVQELSGFDADVIDRAGQEMVRTRRKTQTPLVSECIAACLDARRFVQAQKRAETLPTLTDVSNREGRYGAGREALVFGTLLKTSMAKQAAREGWIAILSAYCFEHGRLPTDGDDIARMKRQAREIDEWTGGDGPANLVIAKAKIALLEKRDSLAKRVLKEDSQ